MDDALVALGLAGDAGADAGKRLAAALRDRLSAIVAFLGTVAFRSERPGPQDRIGDRVVDLILNRSVASPTTCYCCILSAT